MYIDFLVEHSSLYNLKYRISRLENDIKSLKLFGGNKRQIEIYERNLAMLKRALSIRERQNTERRASIKKRRITRRK
jgi:hypothetical protein